MTGDDPHHEQRTQETTGWSRSGVHKGESEGGGDKRNRPRRSGGGGSGRRSAYRFDDQMEHDICQLVTHRTPAGFPVNGRPELATMPPVEVTGTETRILYCNHQHAGIPHLAETATKFWITPIAPPASRSR